jgi:methyl-accepting chemotaxis protein
MVEDLETSNGKLSGVGEKLSELSSDSLEKVAATDEILKSIGGIAKQSNILGINAAIEAARAGELGKGFGVVAKEIQKFSNQNVNSLKVIEETLKQICASSENVNDEVGHIREFVKKQAEVMSELSSVTQQLYSVSVLLKDLAEKMIERK